MIRSDGPTEMNVPETVRPCPPREIVVPAMEKAVGTGATGFGRS